MTDSIVDVLDKVDTNIAATLRDIAANCDTTTGKVLRQCERAANEGKTHIIAKVSEEDREFLYRRELNKNHPQYVVPPVTPLVEKLESLGFKLLSQDKMHWFYSTKCYIKVSW